MVKVKPARSPRNSSAAEAKPPKMGVIAALRQAIVQAWIVHPTAPAPEAPPPLKTSLSAVPEKPQPPGWVNAAPKIKTLLHDERAGGSLHDAYLECERELPKTLQAAVTENAELKLGHEAEAVRLPDDALQQLVQERWTETRPMEIGDTSQDMVTLHALAVSRLPPEADQVRGPAARDWTAGARRGRGLRRSAGAQGLGLGQFEAAGKT